MITAQQQRFFEVFGFLHLPGVFRAEAAMMSEEYENVYRTRADVQVVRFPDGTPWITTIHQLFVSMSPRLSAFIEDPRVVGICTGLLGEDYSVCGGDGSIYHRHTNWHSDGWGELCAEVRHIKVAWYLDPLTRGTGALRVIPGSHRSGEGFGEELERLLRDGAVAQAECGIGVEGVPAFPIECVPGDVVIFDWRTKHASVGGGHRRRMFDLNVQAALRTERQRELALRCWRGHRDAGHPLKWEPGFIESAPPERLRRLATTVELIAQVKREREEVAAGA